MINLLKETMEILKEHNKTFKDVRWIGGDDFTISVESFKVLADKEYDNSYGSPEIATDLKVVGDDWWLERSEYDGSEWWEFKTMPARPRKERKIHTLVDGSYNTLEEMNEVF